MLPASLSERGYYSSLCNNSLIHLLISERSWMRSAWWMTRREAVLARTEKHQIISGALPVLRTAMPGSLSSVKVTIQTLKQQPLDQSLLCLMLTDWCWLMLVMLVMCRDCERRVGVPWTRSPSPELVSVTWEHSPGPHVSQSHIIIVTA